MRSKFKITESVDRIKKYKYMECPNCCDEYQECCKCNNYNLVNSREFKTIIFDLNVLDIIIKKKVNIFDIWWMDNQKQYKEHYPFAKYHAEKDMLSEKEFESIKETLKYSQ